MLAAMMRFRPNRSMSQPPSNPNTPPDNADSHSNRPVHCVTAGLFGGNCNNSAIAGTPTSGVINSSYVSNRKPIAAMAQTSHCVGVRGGRVLEGTGALVFSFHCSVFHFTTTETSDPCSSVFIRVHPWLKEFAHIRVIPGLI